MKKFFLISIIIAVLIIFLSCTAIEASEPVPTPDTFIEEELAAQAIATAKAEKTQRASRDIFYAQISNGEQAYLAFWFIWNNETILLPLADLYSTNSLLISCRIESSTPISIGELVPGFKFIQDECVMDENAPVNAHPIIKIPGYIDEGIIVNTSNYSEEKIWNIIDLHRKYADNFSDIVSFIIKNDMVGSGDLSISIHKTDGTNGDYDSETTSAPAFILPAEALQVAFPAEKLDFFEQAEDVIYELEREFTWKIPDGYEELNLSPEDENWFVLQIRETKPDNKQEEEYIVEAYIQIKGVGAPPTP